MKKIYLLAATLFSAFSFGQTSEDFPTTGALNANGWATHSGTAGQLTITSGSLNYPGITNSGNKVVTVAGNSEDANRAVGLTITTTAYYSVIVNVPNTTGMNTAGDYSLHLAPGITTPPTLPSPFAGRLYFKPGSVANTFNVGVWNNSNATGGTGVQTFVATDYPIGTPIFVVVKYDLATNTASLFVNPALNSTEPAPNLTNSSGTTAAPTSIASIAIRQGGNATTGTGNLEYDTLRVSDNWAFVTSGTLATKEFGNISGLKMFPVPAKNILNVTSDSFATKTVEIYNVLGTKVISSTVENGAVNISNLSKGVYVVKIKEEEKTATRQLIVE